jgi:hypothetical protein
VVVVVVVVVVVELRAVPVVLLSVESTVPVPMLALCVAVTVPAVLTDETGVVDSVVAIVSVVEPAGVVAVLLLAASLDVVSDDVALTVAVVLTAGEAVGACVVDAGNGVEVGSRTVLVRVTRETEGNRAEIVAEVGVLEEDIGPRVGLTKAEKLSDGDGVGVIKSQVELCMALACVEAIKDTDADIDAVTTLGEGVGRRSDALGDERVGVGDAGAVIDDTGAIVVSFTLAGLESGWFVVPGGAVVVCVVLSDSDPVVVLTIVELAAAVLDDVAVLAALIDVAASVAVVLESVLVVPVLASTGELVETVDAVEPTVAESVGVTVGVVDPVSWTEEEERGAVLVDGGESVLVVSAFSLVGVGATLVDAVSVTTTVLEVL